MNNFTASNGIEISVANGASGTYLLGSLPANDCADQTHATGSSKGIQALREFFQAEADERLGRWRWPENPDYVVYLDDGYAVVVSESDPSRRPDRVHRRYIKDPEGSLGWGEFAARAYFDAHPEPKPWHEATEGEVWILMFANSSHAWFVNGEYFQSTKTLTNISKSDVGIVAGRRIFPDEVAS